MREEIKVHVVKYPDRPNLVMRYKCPVTDKHVSRSTGTKRRKEAEKIAAKWEAALQEGRYQRTSRMTWEDFRENHQSILQVNMPAETAKKYQTTFNFIESHMRPKLLRAVTTEAVSKWSNDLMREGRKPTTVAVYCRHLRAAMNWARDMGYIPTAPKVKVPKTDRTTRSMKGRPIVTEEHERILLAVTKAVPEPFVAEWQLFLEGLWWSGLRLNEALALSWSESAPVAIVDAGGVMAIRFKPEGHKARRAESIPCAPEFRDLLNAIPEQARRGRVFRLQRWQKRGELSADRIGRTITAIASKANVLVGDVKPASAHDYRRAFGTRWARRVKPATLQRLMRHRDIQTTLKYYVEQDLHDMAADMEAALGTNLGTTAQEKAPISAE